jgi:hypothetical protein
MPHSTGKVDRGHPYIDIVVSLDGKTGTGEKFTALIDTGYSGFVSVPVIAALKLGLQPHTTVQYELANGKISDPVPLARAHACCCGDVFAPGLVGISEAASVTVGMEFLRACGKGLIVFSASLLLVDEKEFLDSLKKEEPAAPEKGVSA